MKRLLAGILIALVLSNVPAYAFYFNPTPWYARYCEHLWTRKNMFATWLAANTGC